MPTTRTTTPVLRFPWPTRIVADFYGVPEHVIQYALRCRDLTGHDEPPIVNGRRMWWARSVRALEPVLLKRKSVKTGLTPKQRRAIARAER